MSNILEFNIKDKEGKVVKCYMDYDRYLLEGDYYEWLKLTFPYRKRDLPEELKFENWRKREKNR